MSDGMSAAEIVELEVRHARQKRNDFWVADCCGACLTRYPCTISNLIREVRRLQEVIAGLTDNMLELMG